MKKEIEKSCRTCSKCTDLYGRLFCDEVEKLWFAVPIKDCPKWESKFLKKEFSKVQE